MSDGGVPRGGKTGPPPGSGGLCPGCASVQAVRSARGSLFLRCRLSSIDPRFPKYPPQPVVRCTGHQPRSEPNRTTP